MDLPLLQPSLLSSLILCVLSAGIVSLFAMSMTLTVVLIDPVVNQSFMACYPHQKPHTKAIPTIPVMCRLTCGVEEHGQPGGGLRVHPELHLVPRSEDQDIQKDQRLPSRGIRSRPVTDLGSQISFLPNWTENGEARISPSWPCTAMMSLAPVRKLLSAMARVRRAERRMGASMAGGDS